MLVRGVASWSMEVGLGLNLLSVGDDGPSSDMVEEQADCFVGVADVFLLLLFDVLCADNLFNGGDSAGVDGLLEFIFLIEGILILLEF